MKSILLSTIAILLAATGFSQNVSTVSQNGTSLTANVGQTGTSLTAIISQVGTPATNSANTGVTIQTGTGHSAIINQDNGSTNNRGGIAQVGSGPGSNTGVISQSNGSGGTTKRSNDPNVSIQATDGNWAGVAQTGSTNSATVIQDGAGTKANFGESWQKGSDNQARTTQSGGVDNRAEIFQGDDTRGDTPSVPASQGINVNVTSNTATIDQSNSSTNDAYIHQFSNNNSTFVSQSGATSTSNVATVQQGQNGTGGNGSVRIFQGSAAFGEGSTGNTATAFQLGEDSNFIDIFQGAILPGGSVSNVASVSQTAPTGTFNFAAVSQFSDNAGSTDRNRATILQQGGQGDAVIAQYKDSDDNVASIRQGVNSTGDIAFIQQSDSYSNTVSITQNLTTTGGGNIADVREGNFATTGSATSMTVLISQEGSQNQARLQQLGTGSKAAITQSGNNNIVKGPANNTDFNPGLPPSPNDPGGTFADQTGTGHILTLTQTSPGSTNTTIFNTADVQQLSTSNTLTGIQTAVDVSNLTTVRQNGIMNNAFVQQTGATTLP